MYLKKIDSYTKLNFFIEKFRYIYCFSFDKPFLLEIKKYLLKYSGIFLMKAKKFQIIKNIRILGNIDNLNLSGYFFLCGSNSINEFVDFYFNIISLKILNEFLLFCVIIDKCYISEKYFLHLHQKKKLKEGKLIISIFKIFENIFYCCNYYLFLSKQIFSFLIEFSLLKI